MTASPAPPKDNPPPAPDAEGWATLRRFLPYLWPKGDWPLRRRIVVALTFVLLAKAVTLTLPFAYAGAVDAMSQEGLVEEAVLVAFALVMFVLERRAAAKRLAARGGREIDVASLIAFGSKAGEGEVTHK